MYHYYFPWSWLSSVGVIPFAVFFTAAAMVLVWEGIRHFREDGNTLFLDYWKHSTEFGRLCNP